MSTTEGKIVYDDEHVQVEHGVDRTPSHDYFCPNCGVKAEVIQIDWHHVKDQEANESYDWYRVHLECHQGCGDTLWSAVDVVRP